MTSRDLRQQLDLLRQNQSRRQRLWEEPVPIRDHAKRPGAHPFPQARDPAPGAASSGCSAAGALAAMDAAAALPGLPAPPRGPRATSVADSGSRGILSARTPNLSQQSPVSSGWPLSARPAMRPEKPPSYLQNLRQLPPLKQGTRTVQTKEVFPKRDDPPTLPSSASISPRGLQASSSDSVCDLGADSGQAPVRGEEVEVPVASSVEEAPPPDDAPEPACSPTPRGLGGIQRTRYTQLEHGAQWRGPTMPVRLKDVGVEAAQRKNRIALTSHMARLQAKQSERRCWDEIWGKHESIRDLAFQQVARPSKTNAKVKASSQNLLVRYIINTAYITFSNAAGEGKTAGSEAEAEKEEEVAAQGVAALPTSPDVEEALGKGSTVDLIDWALHNYAGSIRETPQSLRAASPSDGFAPGQSEENSRPQTITPDSGFHDGDFLLSFTSGPATQWEYLFSTR